MEMLTPSYNATNLALCTACQSAFILWITNKWKSYESRRSLKVELVDSLTDIKSFTYEDGTPQYPFAVTAPAGVQLDTDRGGLSKRFTAIEAGKSIQNRAGRLIRATPVKVGMGFQFRSDDMNDLWSMTTLLYNTAPGPTLSLMMPDTGFTFQSRVYYPPDLDFAMESHEDGQYVSMDVSIVLNSWIGQFIDVGLIGTVIIRLIDDSGTMDHQLQFDPTTNKWYPQPFSVQEKTQMTSFQEDSWTYTSRG